MNTVDWWSGAEGDVYTQRNRVDWHARVPFWCGVLQRTGARKILEVGSNAGWNLSALAAASTHALLLTGLEINEKAAREANDRGDVHATYWGPATDAPELFAQYHLDLVFTAGMLIHVAPQDLEQIMRAVISVSKRWVLAVEYAADQEQEIEYRGQMGLLWKRPYGKLYEALGLTLVREWDAGEGFDNCRSWLLEKRTT